MYVQWVFGLQGSLKQNSFPFVKQKCSQLKYTININLMKTSIYDYVTFSFDLAQLFGIPVVKGTLNLR